MRLSIQIILLSFVMALFSGPVNAETYVCGIASGYPPYQFQRYGTAAGLDAEVARRIGEKLGVELVFFQGDWDDVFNQLRFGKIDFIAGMEINEVRMQLFDFSPPYYHRYDAVFVRENERQIHGVKDLYNKIITGDRHSFLELRWQKEGIKDKIRIMQTPSKRKAMQLLEAGNTQAAIMPRAVGRFLAKEMDLPVRILTTSDAGSPVALAVKKGEQGLLEKLNAALDELIRGGELQQLKDKWL
ncbi:MAG: transporter substrate-binding domain-containing protein [Desulfobacter sp.]|nr:MAG: transporter substrate-binding domain-containing protein [Desulfobacter sp.]